MMLWLEGVAYKLLGSSLVWGGTESPEDTPMSWIISLHSISYVDVQVLTEWSQSQDTCKPIERFKKTQPNIFLQYAVFWI